MPTISTRNFGRNKKHPDETFTLLGSPKPTGTQPEVAEVQLKWSSSMGCPAPPCKYTFWWSTPPKTVGRKSAKTQK